MFKRRKGKTQKHLYSKSQKDSSCGDGFLKGGIAGFSDDTNDSFVYNLKEHKNHEENSKATADSYAKNSRIIGEIYKPRRMVAAVLAAAMFLFVKS